MSDDFELPVSEEEYESEGSKFANAGEHLSEITNVDWDTPGKSIKFEFCIVSGPDKGVEGKISAGVTAGAAWKLKQCLQAIGVPVEIKNGKVHFSGAACVGKQFICVWTPQKDTRPPEEGGTGNYFTKPTSMLPVGTQVEK